MTFKRMINKLFHRQDRTKDYTCDILSIEFNESENIVLSSGMSFKEFILSLDHRPNYILYLEYNYNDLHHYPFHQASRNPYCTSDDLDAIIHTEVAEYGDFAFIDFDDLNALESLTPREISELYYMARIWKPLQSPFSDRLQNRFMYNAHDDDWVTQIYYRDLQDFRHVLPNILALKASTLHGITLPPMDEPILDALLDLCQSKIAFDFENIMVDSTITIPICLLPADRHVHNIYTLRREEQLPASHHLIYDTRWHLKIKGPYLKLEAFP